MKSTNHVHKLKRHTYKTGSRIYQCVLDCSFRVACELALGRRCICWRCGKEFSLNAYSLQLAKPHCEDCHVFKNEVKNKKESSLVSTVTSNTGDSIIDSMRQQMNSIVKEYVPVKEEDEDML